MLVQDKKKIRQLALQQRNNVHISPALYKNLLQNAQTYLENIMNDEYIAGYYPTVSELNLLPLLEKFPHIVMPVITEDYNLEFYQWHKNTKMITSQYASMILEPLDREQAIAPMIIIAPLIAADRSGNRIGSGKGIYDRAITNLRSLYPKLIYLAICYDYQLFEQIPVENHDQKLDIIITETEILSCR